MTGSTAYDVIVVGGGLAGASAAGVLVDDGLSVLVLERDIEFRDRVRGEWLAPWGTVELRALGLEPVLERAGANVISTVVNRSGRPVPLVTPTDVPSLGFFHPRAQEALLTHAAERGAEVKRGARVQAIEPGAPPTVSYTLDGVAQTASARLVVGADGRSSTAREASGLPEHEHRSARVLAGVRLAGVRCPDDYSYFLIRDSADGLASMFPQGDGIARAYVFLHGTDQAALSGEGGFRRFIEIQLAAGMDAEILADATQEGPLGAFFTNDSWVDHPFSDGLVLIGDAAGITDPMWGLGISLAMRDVRNLRDRLRADDDWEAACHGYADEHDEYFAAILAGENWQSELLLTPGPEARERRRHATRAWSQDPSRLIDLPGLGPAIDSSEEGRRRFFAEDIARD